MADNIQSLTDGKFDNPDEKVEYGEVLKKVDELEKETNIVQL